MADHKPVVETLGGLQRLQPGDTLDAPPNADQALSSGWITGFEVTINAINNFEIDIAVGHGVVIDWTTKLAPIVKLIGPVGPFIGISMPDIVNDLFTEVFITDAGIPFLQGGDQVKTPQQRRSMIALDSVSHIDGVTINFIGGGAQPAYHIVQALFDFIDEQGPINTGNLAEPAATDLTIGKTAGSNNKPFINSRNNWDDPNRKPDAAIAVINPVVYLYQDGIGGVAVTTRTAIDPDLFDDGTGILTTVGSNQYLIQRFGHGIAQNVTFILVPQFSYGSMAVAIAAVDTEDFNFIAFNNTRTTLTTDIAIRANATDLTDTAKALFIRKTAGFSGGGGSGVSTYIALQDTSNLNFIGEAGSVPIVNDVEGALTLTELVQSKTFTMKGGPAEIGTRLQGQAFPFSFACIITSLRVVGQNPITAGTYTFKLTCGTLALQNDVGTVSLVFGVDTQENETVGLSFAVSAGWTAFPEITAIGTQAETGDAGNFSFQFTYKIVPVAP